MRFPMRLRFGSRIKGWSCFAITVIFGLFTLLGSGAVKAVTIPLTADNPGFEQDFSGWATHGEGGSLSIDQTVFHSGSKSAKLIMQSGGGEVNQEISVSLSSESVATFSLWLLMPTAAIPQNKLFTFYISALDDFGSELANSEERISGAFPDWTLMSVSVTVPSNTASFKIAAHTRNGGGTGGFSDPLWIDDIAVTVPEPSTALLLGLGLVGLGLRKKFIM